MLPTTYIKPDVLEKFRLKEWAEATDPDTQFCFAALRDDPDFWIGDVINLCNEADGHGGRRFRKPPRRRLLPQFGASFMLVANGPQLAWVYLDHGDAELDLVTEEEGANVTPFLFQRELRASTDLTQKIRVGDREIFRYFFRRGNDPTVPVTPRYVSPIRSIIFAPAMTRAEKALARAAYFAPAEPKPQRLEERDRMREIRRARGSS